MKLRPLNRTLIIEPDLELMPVDPDPNIIAIVKRGIIVIPDKNPILKITDRATVIRAAADCKLAEFKEGQRIIYDQFADTPHWYDEGNHRYRFIKEWYIRLIYA